MDHVHVIRYKVLVEGRSVRQVAREMGISRNTAKRYLEGAAPGERATPVRARPVLDRVRDRLEELLASSAKWTGGKQRLTASRLWRMLRDEGHEVGETLVKEYVHEWRRARREVFVPLEYAPGDLAEVDFFEVLVDLEGERRKAWMFLMRLMHSGRDFAWLYPRQDQVCFLDGHVRAFEHFGCVPHRIAYDNLRAAVTRILVGSERELAARFEALSAHYVFEASFCRPGTGHDKGGVEARGKGIRWQHLVPIPAGDDLGAISSDLLARLDAEAATTTRSGATVAERFSAESERMLPLPPRPFRSAAVRLVSTSRRSLAKVEGAYYSVPCRWAGLDITAYAGVDEVELVGPDQRVVHARKPFGARAIDYRHYLPELARKPQALRQVAATLVAQLGEPFDAAWRLLVDAHGPKEAARLYTRILGAILELGEDAVARRLRRALADDVPVVLALAKQSPPAKTIADDAIPAVLAAVVVEAGAAADYDALFAVEDGGDRIGGER